MNSYSMSDGTRVKKSVIDRRVRTAKASKIQQMRMEYDYVFCEDCGKNEMGGEFIDCSHTISVDEAQKNGQCELAWSIENIKMRCRTCHRKLDKTY